MYESDFNRSVVDNHGRKIDLFLDEDELIIRAKHDYRALGEMHFRLIEEEFDQQTLKLVWMYLDHAGSAYTRSGIGRQMLQLIYEFNGGPVVTESVGGAQQEDGSHLTGDAPSFVAKMRKEGLIA